MRKRRGRGGSVGKKHARGGRPDRGRGDRPNARADGGRKDKIFRILSSLWPLTICLCGQYGHTIETHPIVNVVNVSVSFEGTYPLPSRLFLSMGDWDSGEVRLNFMVILGRTAGETGGFFFLAEEETTGASTPVQTTFGGDRDGCCCRWFCGGGCC